MGVRTDGIRMNGITKDFSGKLALEDVSIHIQEGTIHAIVGENGAGKSTLMSILSGVLQPTKGTISIDGQEVRFRGTREATRLGIGMVYQHFMLIPILKVWQNIILGVEPRKKSGTIHQAQAIREIQAACEAYGTTLNMEELVGNLTVGEQQRVEILKVLYRKAKYIILDEPTAVLTPGEIQQLLDSMRALKKAGKTILFISHKLDEVLDVSDEISVLRQGRYMGTVTRQEATKERLVEMMVGREINIDGKPLPVERGNPAIRLQNVTTGKTEFGCALQGISVEAYEGEVLGFAGVDGNGQQELVESILGLQKVEAGNIMVLGGDTPHLNTDKIRKMGVACIPPDRQHEGLVMDSSITHNAVLGNENLPQFRWLGPLFSVEKIRTRVAQLLRDFDVRYGSTEEPIRDLSGGNQQKVIIARECALTDPQVILAVNPTRGLDIGAIRFVYEKLEEYKAAGKCIILISTELSEIVRLSDRIGLLYQGLLMDVLENRDIDLQEIGALMLGGVKKEVGP